ncbi:unnamed protein product [Paramecium pentaurelia]|uniref:Uncharacterized protein n=1 Tax=Paramecium pentaurelia TaxID=43138 RepID=A0A8S1U5T4_9CILI|nr:unnamed protein product [Paramecium pentaurelia]
MCVITEIILDSIKGSLLAKVQFNDPYKYQNQTNFSLFLKVLILDLIRNRKYIIYWNYSSKYSCFHFERRSWRYSTGCYATIIGHSDDGAQTRVRLTFSIKIFLFYLYQSIFNQQSLNTRITLSSLCRTTVGLISRDRKTEKTILKGIGQFQVYYFNYFNQLSLFINIIIIKCSCQKKRYSTKINR